MSEKSQQDMVTPEVIQQWKQRYGSVYKTTIAGQEFYFRPIYRFEMVQIREWLQQNQDATVDQMDEKVVEYCLLAPKWTIADFLVLPAGVISTLSRAIQERSGFDEAPMTEEVHNALYFDPPTQEQVQQWKSEYPRVFIIRLGKLVFAVRPIRRHEWEMAQRQVIQNPQSDANHQLLKATLLHPGAEWLDRLPAGYYDRLIEGVYQVSGFGETPVVEEL